MPQIIWEALKRLFLPEQRQFLDGPSHSPGFYPMDPALAKARLKAKKGPDEMQNAKAAAVQAWQRLACVWVSDSLCGLCLLERISVFFFFVCMKMSPFCWQMTQSWFQPININVWSVWEEGGVGIFVHLKSVYIYFNCGCWKCCTQRLWAIHLSSFIQFDFFFGGGGVTYIETRHNSYVLLVWFGCFHAHIKAESRHFNRLVGVPL